MSVNGCSTDPEAPLPRLRHDLVVSRQDGDKGTSFVVKDPVSRRYFRFGELEHHIAAGLDGDTGLEEIASRVQAELGVAYPAEQIEAFIQKLQRLGLLEDSSGRVGETGGGRRRRTSSLLFVKVKALDPHRLLARLLPLARPFFSRGFVILVFLLLAVALALMSGNWAQLAEQTRELMRPSTAPLFLVVFLLIAVVHELAHGLTCTHFGGEVHEMGLLLVFFVPAVYCDVSDAWLFRERGQKLWVSFAGVFFQLFIWSLAVLAWRVTAEAPAINDLLCLTIVICGITAVLNLNPLIKLDGYYLLSDFLDEPNLHRASFTHLVREVRALFGRGDRGRWRPTARQRWIYLAYAVSAGVFSAALLLILPLRTAVAIAARLSWPVAAAIAVLAVALGVTLQLRQRRSAEGRQ